jgi:hypothetical protein
VRTLTSASEVAMCPTRGAVRTPDAVNLPGDCAIAIGAWLDAPSTRGGKKWLSLIATLAHLVVSS